MRRIIRNIQTGALVVLGLIFSCVVKGDSQEGDSLDKSAGDFTVMLSDESAFSQPAPVLTYKQSKVFKRGRIHFNQRWVVFPLTGGDWGLGPTFIADRCSACHVNAGRGNMPGNSDTQLFSALVRVSVPGVGSNGAPKPHPNYGDQFQNSGLVGAENVEDRHFKDGQMLGERVRPEVKLFVDWSTEIRRFADGEEIELRKPHLRIEDLNFGPLHGDEMFSLRLAQPIYGLGLLEAVEEKTLLGLANWQKEKGLNGRPNYVWDSINKKHALGRFGWKANVASIKEQTALAFLSDLGVTTSLFKEENCPPVQLDCVAQPPGNQPELIDINWVELEFWTQALAVPARRNVNDERFLKGSKLFRKAKCSFCHTPILTTGPEFKKLPQLANQTFRAYTDLLLHDMGEELADNRPDFRASGSDWRTPPLWGSGLSGKVSGSKLLLHDGRARSYSEAILWHGGEAEESRELFRKMKKPEREALVFYLNSI